MSIHLIWLQHVRRDAACRARLSATANPYGSSVGHRLVTDRQTDGQRDGTMTHATLAHHRVVKKCCRQNITRDREIAD